jgi:hypothetical protein
MVVVIAWFVLSIFLGLLAGSRGRNQLGWFLLSLLISPLLALVGLMVLPEGGLAHRRFCKESVKPDAVVCKHCGRDLPLAPLTLAPAPEDESSVLKPLGVLLGGALAVITTLVLLAIGGEYLASL